MLTRLESYSEKGVTHKADSNHTPRPRMTSGGAITRKEYRRIEHSSLASEREQKHLNNLCASPAVHIHALNSLHTSPQLRASEYVRSCSDELDELDEMPNEPAFMALAVFLFSTHTYSISFSVIFSLPQPDGP